MSGAPSERPEAAPVLDRDLYCIECGYNLRGLSGDPVRCPECGLQNAVTLMEIPADQIVAQLKRMESAPAYSFAALLLIISGLALQATWGMGPRVAPGLCVSPTIVGLILFPWSLYRARASCRQQPGWLAAMLAYYAFGGLMFGGTYVILVITGIALYQVFTGLPMPWSPRWNLVAILVGEAVAIAFPVRWYVRWSYRKATQRLRALQRHVAVAIAQEAFRRRATTIFIGGPWPGIGSQPERLR